MAKQPSAQRLRALEAALRTAALDAYLVPMVDAFQSEYIPEDAARLPFLTGFTGSAGTAICLAQPSVERRHTLWVDGRYTLQAANEVDTSELVVLNSGEVSMADWVNQHATTPLRIGLDPWLVTIAQFTRWRDATANSAAEWVIEPKNPIDGIWTDRPAAPGAPIALHGLEYAGVSYEEKRAPLLDLIRSYNADALLIAQPDAINWLLNIRGGDIPFNPLVLGYLLLRADGSSVFYTYPRSPSPEVAAALTTAQVTLADVNDLFAGAGLALSANARLLVDPSTTPLGIALWAESASVALIECDDPTARPKAEKNPTEQQGTRAAHLRDGLALTRFLYWVQASVRRKHWFNELEAAEKLEFFRARDALYRGASFATIAGAGAHGAIIHYRADEKTSRRIASGELFLLDSGGQYPDGTTDVTRTIAIGKPSDAMVEHYTRVLKGHIALAAVQFPRGTTGSQLDVLARQYLWQVGLDFDHGTGHGVGSYLCVHEGPQRISKRGSTAALTPGMILSNEPGYYLQGQYGIRIENLMMVQEAKGNMLAFETLTLAPIDTSLIDVTLLTSEERNWLNSYHQRVYQAHAAKLELAERDWLSQATRAI